MTSRSGTFRGHTPPPEERDMPCAGVPSKFGQNSTAEALQQPDEPPTPERQRCYRTVREPGQRVRPPGPLRQDKLDETRVFGDVKTKGRGATEVLDTRKKPLDEYMDSRAEQIYRSVREEPLGRPHTKSTKLPERVKQGDIFFGKASRRGFSAKECLFPERTAGEDPAVVKQYEKSHGDYPPGVQRRHVDWSSTRVDPVRHRFGKASGEGDRDGMANCLNPEREAAEAARECAMRGGGAGPAQHSRVIPLRVQCQKQLAHAPLGHSRPLGLAGYRRPMPEVFGMTSRKPGDVDGDVTAGDCIRGDYTVEEQCPDADLGHAVHAGFRNVPRDPERAFGLPSLRTDIPPRKTISVSNTQNFGQDVPMSMLLNPPAYSDRGVTNEDFVDPRSRSEIREIFERIGEPLTDHEFEQICRRAEDTVGLCPRGKICLEEFRRCLNEYHDSLEDNGEPPHWWHAEVESS